MEQATKTRKPAIDSNLAVMPRFIVILANLFSFIITDMNYFGWQCCKSWELRILYLFVVRCEACKKQVKKYPTASKCIIYFRFLFLNLRFRIGKQNITWFWIRNENLYGLRVKLINRFRTPF